MRKERHDRDKEKLNYIRLPTFRFHFHGDASELCSTSRSLHVVLLGEAVTDHYNCQSINQSICYITRWMCAH